MRGLRAKKRVFAPGAALTANAVSRQNAGLSRRIPRFRHFLEGFILKRSGGRGIGMEKGPDHDPGLCEARRV